MIVSGALSLIYPGLGQIYNGQRKKGLLFLAGQLLSLIAFLYTMGAQVIYLYFFGVWLWSLIDALYTAWQIEQGRVVDSKEPTRRRWVEIGLLGLSAYIIGFFSYQMMMEPSEQIPQEEKAALQSEVGQYLEERYGQSFVVEEPTYLPETEEYRLYAYPEDNPQQRFIVSKNPERLLDGYISLLYKEQAQKELSDLVEELYSNVWRAEAKVGVGRLEGNFAKGIPSYQETRQHHPDKLMQEVEIDLIYKINEGNKKKELGKILRLVHHYRETGLQNIKFTISYFDPQLLDNEKGMPENKKRDDYEEKYLRHQVSLGVADRVKTVDDIAELLVYFPKKP